MFNKLLKAKKKINKIKKEKERKKQNKIKQNKNQEIIIRFERFLH